MIERPDEVAAAIARDRFAQEDVMDRESAAGIEPARPYRPALSVEQNMRIAVRNAKAFHAIEGYAVCRRSDGSPLQFDRLPTGSIRSGRSAAGKQS